MATKLFLNSEHGMIVEDTDTGDRWGLYNGKCINLNGPVQLVPRVIPGTYGKVRVTEGGYVHCKSMKTAEEIRDTIATLEQIAEAM